MKKSTIKFRLISIALTIVTIVGLLPIQALTIGESSQVLYGDADGNGKVDLQDVYLMEKYIADPETAINFTLADVNADGKVDSADVELVKAYLVDNIDSLTPVLCTVSFDTDGAEEVEPMTVGQGFPLYGEIPTPNKRGFIFTGWVKADGSPFFPAEAVTEDMTVKATYEPVDRNEQIDIHSFALKDQPADLTFKVEGDVASADEVLENLTFVPKDGSDPVELAVTANNDGTYTISAKDGFTPGASYELALGNKLSFVDKDKELTTAIFVIHKDQGDRLYYNEDLIFIKDTEEMVYTVDGKDQDVLVAALLDNDSSDDAIVGTFVMSGKVLAVNDYVCIYEKIDPRQRDYTKNDYEDDAIAYIKITGKNGNVYAFQSLNEEDAENILAMPDTIPYKVDVLPREGEGTVSKNNFDAGTRTKLGLTDAPQFHVYDLLVFYTQPYEDLTADSPVRYAQITKTEGDTVYFETITREYIDEFMGLYVTTSPDPSLLLASIDQESILNQVKEQALNSGFTNDATQLMIGSAFQTEDIKQKLYSIGMTDAEISEIALNYATTTGGTTTTNPGGGTTTNPGGGTTTNPGGGTTTTPGGGTTTTPGSGTTTTPGGGTTTNPGTGTTPGQQPGYPMTPIPARTKFVVESVVVTPTFIYSDRYENGIGIKLELSVVLSVTKTIPGKVTKGIKIELTAAFHQELELDINVDIDDQWDYSKLIPLLTELTCKVSLDIKSYTSFSVGAKIYTVSEANQAMWQALQTPAYADPQTRQMIRDINRLGVLAKKAAMMGQSAEKTLEEIERLTGFLPKVQIDGVEYSYDKLMEALEAEDVSEAFEEVFSAKTEAENKVGIEQLMDKYNEMLETESDWLDVLDLSIFSREFHIKVVAIKISVNFKIRVNIKISLGADIEYEVGKRYNFWIKIVARESGSNEIDLLDERFGFQFYVMGALGLRVGFKIDVAVGIISTRVGSVGVNVEFGPYLKINGYFIYIYTRLRPANTTTWNVNEELMGAMYVEFGLYLVVKFKAQAFDNAFKYEPTLYEGEFPLVTAGVKKNVYAFALEPTKDDPLYIWDNDSDSTNGIYMKLPDVYRRMRNIDMMTGKRQQELYDLSKFTITFSDPAFSIDMNTGIINVKPDAADRVRNADMRIVWKCDKLAFSKYDIDITVPVVWTNLNQSELAEKHTVMVQVGDSIVWSTRVSPAETFDLPVGDEIMDLIGYNSYQYGDTNVMYSAVDGYGLETTEDLTALADTIYHFDVTYRTYTLNVQGVQNADGSTKNMSFTTTYDGRFALDDLKYTGKNQTDAGIYTKFDRLVMEDGTAFDLTNRVDLSFFEAADDGVLNVTAEYSDEARTAVFDFIDLDIPDYEVIFKVGEAPKADGIYAYVKELTDGKAEIISITPIVAPTESSITYSVSCKMLVPAPEYELTFVTNGGSEIATQQHPAGQKLLFKPVPAKTGYTFAGWYRDEALTDLFVFGDDTLMPENDMTLYAKWEANSYQVSFVSTTGSADPITVTYDQTYGTLPVLSGNLSFKGWYTEPNGSGDKITAQTVVKITNDITLYAHWLPKITPDEVKEHLVLENVVGMKTYTYDEGEHPLEFHFTAPYEGLEKDFKVTYSREVAGGNVKVNAPVDAGTYILTLERAGDNDYEPIIWNLGDKMRIDRADLQLTGHGAVSMGNSLLALTPDGIKGGGEVTYKISGKASKSQNAPFFTNLANGTYNCEFHIDQSLNYNAKTISLGSVKVNGLKSMGYTVKLYTETKDDIWHDAGTDSKVYAILYRAVVKGNSGSVENVLVKTLMDHGGNDFQSGDKDTYTIASNVTPWEVGDMALQVDGKDGWTYTKIELIFEKSGAGTHKYTVYNDSNGNTVDNVTYPHYTETMLNRKLNGYGDFQDQGSTTIDLSAPYTFSYNGQVNDQDYGTYNVWEYYGAPEFTVFDGQSENYEDFIKWTGYGQFTIDTVELAKYMRQNNKGSFDYTVQMEFKTGTLNNKYKPTYTIHVQAPTDTVEVQSASSASVVQRMAAGSVSENAVTVFSEKVHACPGDTIEIPVSLMDNMGIWGVWGKVGFDADSLELLGVTGGNVFPEDQYTFKNDLTDGNFKYVAAGRHGSKTTANGKLLTLKFKVKDTAAEKTYTLDVSELQVISAAGFDVGKNVHNGRVDVSHRHVGVFVGANAPDCEQDGNVAHYECSICGACFLDEACTTPIDDVTDPATGHDFKWVVDKEATEEETGIRHEECHCGAKRNEGTVIPELDPPTTGDTSLMSWLILMTISSFAISFFVIAAASKKKKQAR